MATAIVYEGAGGGGTLFQGKKFWVSQRVPSRSRWLELITTNGGEIVPLEKHADVMIADHARKDAPPGSFSWTYIEKSVAKGELEDLQNHVAGPVAGESRPVGSDRPARGTRTAFSTADDYALAAWVTRAEVQGLSTKGNAIYQQLEKANPRHTYQSWRDRWVKYLQHQPRPELPANDITPGPVYERPEKSRKSTKFSKMSSDDRSPPSRQSKQELQKHREISKPTASPKTPLKDQPFTKDDEKILREVYEDILNIDDKRVLEAWEKWAEIHPQHTASEWFKFWIEDIKPLRGAKRRKVTDAPSTNMSGRASRDHVSRSPLSATKDRSADLKELTEPRKNQDSQNREKALFESELTEFALNYDMDVDLHPVVSGRQIQLFDLWQQLINLEFVESAGLNVSERWEEIASRLGFKKSRYPNAPNDLLNIFDSTLADFFEQTSLYREYLHLRNILDENGSLSNTQMERYQSIAPPGHELRFGEGDEIVREREHDDDEVEIFEIPFTPTPNLPSPIRRPGSPGKSRDENRIIFLQNDEAIARNGPSGKGKARMLEIPPTPPEYLNSQDQIYDSPPTKREAFSQEHDDEIDSLPDDGEGIFVKTSLRRKFPIISRQQSSRIIQMEPETQDFHFSVHADGSNVKSGPQRISENVPEARDSPAAIGSIHNDSPTESQIDPEHDEKEVRAFVDHFVSLGYSEEVVTQALLATTLETGDVAMVMEAIMQGAGIPENIEGVWTVRDDEAVRLPDHEKRYAQVVSKHGEARCVKRRQFLNEEALEDIAQGASLFSQEES